MNLDGSKATPVGDIPIVMLKQIIDIHLPVKTQTIKGAVMQIEKAMINDHLHVFQKHPENFAFILFIILQ